MATNLSRRSMIDGIKRRLLALIEITRDEFLQSHPEAHPYQVLLKWHFDRYSGFPTADYDTTNPLPKDLDTWSVYDLERCNSALSHSLISITASLLPVSANTSHVTSEVKEDRKDYRVLRVRLKNMIESTIGREVHKRTGHPINFIKSDPDYPNFFEWVFDDQYLGFPHTALSDFRQDDVEECHKAIDDGNLTVRCVDPPPERSERSESVQNPSLSREAKIRLVRETILRIIEEETGILESIEDVPEILTQRSVIMNGLAWKRGGTYQFPFGNPDQPNLNKLQCTNWSNMELEDTLAALESGDLKLVKIDEKSAEVILLRGSLPRKKDRPRRGNPKDPADDQTHINSFFKRPRRSAPVADDDYIAVDDKSNVLSRRHARGFSLGKIDDMDNNENRDVDLVNLFIEELLHRRTALQNAHDEVNRLQELIREKDHDINNMEVQHQEATTKATQSLADDLDRLQGVLKARDHDISTLELQLWEATKTPQRPLADARAANENIQDGNSPTRDDAATRQKPCASCLSHQSRITELEEKEQRFGKRIEDLKEENGRYAKRVLDLLDRQSDLQTQLSFKSDELAKTKQSIFNGKRVEVEVEDRTRRSMSHKDEPVSDHLYSASPQHADFVINDSRGTTPATDLASRGNESVEDEAAEMPLNIRSWHPKTGPPAQPPPPKLGQGVFRVEIPASKDGKLPLQRHSGNPQWTPLNGAKNEQSTQYFPWKFLKQNIGITGQLFSSVQDRTILQPNIVDWEQVITIVSDVQPSGPKFRGDSGTVMIIDGEPHNISLHKIYPTLLAKIPDPASSSSHSGAACAYIGRYEVTGTRIVSVESWKALPSNVQRCFIQRILRSPPASWVTKALEGTHSWREGHASEPTRINVITELFSKDPPKLRLREYSLRFAFFSDPDYSGLCSALTDFQDGDSNQSSLKRKPVPEDSEDTVSKRRREGL